MPFFESPEDALKDVIQHLGGCKKIAHLIWPDKSIEAASRQLMDCLNTSRNEKLELTQLLKILSIAKEGGYHTAFFWIAEEVGYDAHPVTKAEEVDRLTSVVEQSAKTLSTALASLERIQTKAKTK